MRWMKSTARSRMTEHRNRSRNPRNALKLAIGHRQLIRLICRRGRRF
jgi:hypothetical protein